MSSIGDLAFSRCERLKSVNVPDAAMSCCCLYFRR
ncbi:hypothetical protein [Cycloclasticus sp.]